VVPRGAEGLFGSWTLERAELLAALQRNALRCALGVMHGPAPEGFLVGLAAIGLLSQVAEERPLVCLVETRSGLIGSRSRSCSRTTGWGITRSVDLTASRCRIRNLSRMESVWVMCGSRSPVEVASRVDQLARTLAVSSLGPDVASTGVGGDFSPGVTGLGWLPGAPFLEHGEQSVPDHLVEGRFAWVILCGCGEQGVE